jgi:hypothetical protein
MRKFFLWILVVAAVVLSGCKDDITYVGSGLLDGGDSIVVLADTFPLTSEIMNSGAIVSNPDSVLLGELETDFGTLKADVLTQLACPEGYAYPENAEVDSIALFFRYASWVGDDASPMAINVYELDGDVLNYNRSYTTDIDLSRYCTKTKPILKNKRIIVASEKQDSVMDTNGNYVPMVKMMSDSTSDFFRRFAAIRQFGTQEEFNRQFKGIFIESEFGSSTMLNISDIAIAVYYHFSYDKAGRDTTVNDMKAFYANSEVRTINRIQYLDKDELIDNLASQPLHNYVISPAGVYTAISLPIKEMESTIYTNMVETVLPSGDMLYKRPYVNLAQLRVDVENVFTGSTTDRSRNDWLQPAPAMMLIKRTAYENRFFEDSKLPEDTCAIVATLTQGTDSVGDPIYYYSYDLATLLTHELRQDSVPQSLEMLLIPVTVNTSTLSNTTVISSVKQAQSVSATVIRSAQSGMALQLVYSGF